MKSVVDNGSGVGAKMQGLKLGSRQHFAYAWTSGVDELRKRFDDSLLGGLWLVASPALLILVYWAVFDLVFGISFTDPDTGKEVPFLAAFAIGFFLYLTLAELLNGASGWLRAKRRLILESDLPIWSVLGGLIARVFIQYLFYVAVVLAVTFSYGYATWIGAAIYLIASAGVFVLFCGVALIFALVGSFFGDVKELVPVLMRVLFYTSSITFPLTIVPSYLKWVPTLNPLTYPVELMRDLLLWGVRTPITFVVPILIMTVTIWVIALMLYARLSPRIPEVV